MAAIENPSDSKIGQQAVTAGQFYGVGGDASLIQHLHAQWDDALIAVITFWTSDFPEAALDSVVAGEWVQEIPPTGYTAISPVGSATAGTPLVLTIAGGTAGGASFQIGNIGSKRMRVRVVCTQQGFLRLRPNGKD